MLKEVWRASDAWSILNGVFCVYKPSDMNMYFLRNSLISNLCRDLNQMEIGRPQERRVQIVDDPQSPNGLTVTNVPNLADDVLAVGPRYQSPDVRLSWSKWLGRHTSGLCIMGINKSGGSKVEKLKKGNFINTYQVTGQLGRATDTYHESGRIIAKSTHRHVRAGHLEKILASVQSLHQRQIYDNMGVDIQSQEAYEIASRGPVRPADKSDPLIYGVNLIDFNNPEFIFEVQCINETEVYLMKMVHDIGLDLKSMAVCTKLRQIRSGLFDLRLALLRKHWNLENIINNIGNCRDIAKWNRLNPTSPNLLRVDSEQSPSTRRDLRAT